MKDKRIVIKIGTNVKSIDIVHSNYHYEIFINQYLFNDKATLLMLIKSIIGNYNVQTNSYNIILLKSIDYINDNIIKLFKSLLFIKKLEWLFSLSQSLLFWFQLIFLYMIFLVALFLRFLIF